MVRLKVAEAMGVAINAALFQFHYGTIKSALFVKDYLDDPEFQFHYGTIKSIRYGFLRHGRGYFNSTMVRLKAIVPRSSFRLCTDFNSTMVRLKASSETRISGLELFQFHYGTIKRLSPL